MKQSNTKFESIFFTIWFFIIFVVVCVYCILNWSKVTVLNPFDGNSLMLCYLLFWTFLPFIKKLKFRDFEGELNSPLLQQNKEYAELKLIETAQNIPNINIDVNVQNEYRNEMENIINKKGAKNV